MPKILQSGGFEKQGQSSDVHCGRCITLTQQSFFFFLKLLLNPRWLTLWRFLYCHPPLVYFGFSTKLWRWQFGRSAPIQPIMSCSFDSLLTWQTKLAPDKWSKDKTTENSTHLKCAFSAIIYKLKKKKWSLSFSLDCSKEAGFLNLVYLQIASTFGSTDPLSSTQEKKAFVPADIITFGRKRNNMKPHV